MDSLAELDGQSMTSDLQCRIVKSVVTLYVLRGELGDEVSGGPEPTDAD